MTTQWVTKLLVKMLIDHHYVWVYCACLHVTVSLVWLCLLDFNHLHKWENKSLTTVDLGVCTDERAKMPKNINYRNRNKHDRVIQNADSSLQQLSPKLSSSMPVVTNQIRKGASIKHVITRRDDTLEVRYRYNSIVFSYPVESILNNIS